VLLRGIYARGLGQRCASARSISLESQSQGSSKIGS
jgi:hypothetical protein